MHLYIHIPFCHRICPYCSFHKHTPGGTDMKAFISSLLIEARSRQKEFPIKPVTIYFGGGTPSMLSDRYLKHLFDGLKEIYDWSDVSEVTFEANPATFNDRRARTFHNLGITRMSLGVQSWDPEILHILGREHTPAQAEESVSLLKQAGIPEVNIDLMFSIPGQSTGTWEKSLLKTLEINPEHISAYNLNYEEDTPFFESLDKGQFSLDENRDADFFELTDSLLSKAGYRHYETSNFARDGHISQHNLSYWTGEDYLGFGPGAVSTFAGRRWSNEENTNSYILNTLEKGLPDHRIEIVSDESYRRERIALMLRTDMGISRQYIPKGKEPFLKILQEESLATVTGERLILSDKGRLLVDEIAVEFF